MSCLSSIRAWFVLSIATFLLMGCATGPAIQQQKLLRSPTGKVSQVFFFYQDVVMTTSTTYSKGYVNFSMNETGFDQFGESLVGRAKPVFEKQGVVVPHASVIPPGEWQQQARKVLSTVPPSQIRASHLLVVTPYRGTGNATVHSSSVTFVFRVRLIEGASSSAVWEGLINTQTWKGKDFVMKNIDGHKFDAAYADLFLSQVLDSLKQNSLL